MDRNPQIDLAERYVSETNVSIFLTGKAGTGKTTFLHHIVDNCHKRNVVVAPTGVAAVNAGGVTIHSFFQLPFCPYLPDVPELVTEYQMPEEKKQLRKSKIDIIRTLDLLIIDEISMVRADLLDAVDAVLRRYRRNSRPFGGVQLLMIGDIQQLAPVVTDDEKPYMDRVYPSPFFFHSKALQRLPYITLQLTTIYRQQDPDFVRILNNIRDNKFDTETLATLNQRVSKTSTQSNTDQTPILLTTHNYQADRVNQQRLDALKSQPFTLEAVISGNFPETSVPTDRTLVLKEGAQVMFVKNDSSGSHRYYNGKIGIVEELSEERDERGNMQQVVIVRDDNGDAIHVQPEQWENIKYEIDPADNQIKQHVDGTFTQYPLKTAWAITIHKAQGLTFDRVQVDASAAFTYGQVYVALSRCRTLQGLTLLAPISERCAFDNQDISQFNATIPSQHDAEEKIDAFRLQYYYETLFELFDFSTIQHETEQIERLFQEHLRTTYPQQAALLTNILVTEMANIMSVAERFRRQLGSIGQQNDSQTHLDERIAKAAPYFIEQLKIVNRKVAPLFDVAIDNKETTKRLKELAERYNTAYGLKETLLSTVQRNGFDIKQYQKVKVDFALSKPKKEKEKKDEEVYTDVRNPRLITILTKWRKEKSHEIQLPAYTILTQKSLLGIADKLPHDGKSLLKIPGIGAAKVAKYGVEIIQIIDDYCESLAHPKEPVYQQAARLFSEGVTIEDIAGQMLRAPSTVEGYIFTAVENGVLDPDLVLTPDEQDEIVSFLLEIDDKATLKSIYDHFDGRFSYLKLRVARYLAREL